MGWGSHYSGDFEYESVAARAERIQKDIAKRRAKGHRFDPVEVPARARQFSKTFWGQAWCRHLECHSDYEHRLPRGRSYLRNGQVFNLEIDAESVTAHVYGSEIYDVRITITPLEADAWMRLKTACAGHVESLLDLLTGRLNDSTLKILTEPDTGIFPRPREMTFICSCPDYADLCKHVAATLYAVAVRLDAAPELLFTLRGVNPAELFQHANANAKLTEATTDTALEGEDLSALFGIEIAEGPPTPEATKEEAAPRKAARKVPVAKKPAASKRSARTKAVGKKKRAQ